MILPDVNVLVYAHREESPRHEEDHAWLEKIVNSPPSYGISDLERPRHRGILLSLCHATEAKGSLVPDTYIAALAIESGSAWITTDRDDARFPGLSWRHPLD